MNKPKGLAVPAIRAKITKLGDLGAVINQQKKTQNLLFKPKPLYIDETFKKLNKIAHTSGKDVIIREKFFYLFSRFSKSQKLKSDIIKELINSAKDEEGKFLVRILLNKMRIGLAQNTIIYSLGKAFAITKSEGKDVDEDKLKQNAKTIQELYEYVVESSFKYDQFVQNKSSNLGLKAI